MSNNLYIHETLARSATKILTAKVIGQIDGLIINYYVTGDLRMAAALFCRRKSPNTH